MTEKEVTGREKKISSILNPVELGQACVVIVSSSLNQNKENQTNKEFTSQNQADSSALIHRRSPDSPLPSQMVAMPH